VTGKAECPAENTLHGISWKITLAVILVSMARHEIPSEIIYLRPRGYRLQSSEFPFTPKESQQSSE
ncbi:hypothetical protein CIB84_010686, partial [Bambusicola thoracicus]